MMTFGLLPRKIVEVGDRIRFTCPRPLWRLYTLNPGKTGRTPLRGEVIHKSDYTFTVELDPQGFRESFLLLDIGLGGIKLEQS